MEEHSLKTFTLGVDSSTYSVSNPGTLESGSREKSKLNRKVTTGNPSRRRLLVWIVVLRFGPESSRGLS